MVSQYDPKYQDRMPMIHGVDLQAIYAEKVYNTGYKDPPKAPSVASADASTAPPEPAPRQLATAFSPCYSSRTTALDRCSRAINNWRDPNCTTVPVLPEQQRRRACVGRNIYVDLGANWCNTLDIFQYVPNVATMSNAGQPWHVYAFEASPLIAPYVEKCTKALTRGLPLPPPPVPPTASSGQLLAYASQLGCDKVGGKQARFACMSKALDESLQKLRPDAALSANASLLQTRLERARTRGCKGAEAGGSGGGGGAGLRARTRRAGGTTFHLLPAAAGHVGGSMRMAGTPEQMLRGGAFRTLSNASRLRGRGGDTYEVAQVDVVRWLLRSFTRDDFVVLKMDVEGAENEIVPRLLLADGAPTIDVFMWECHAKWRGEAGKCRCLAWEEALRQRGVKSVYRDPYYFLPTRKDGGWQKLPEWHVGAAAAPAGR